MPVLDLPRNLLTERRYTGINILLRWHPVLRIRRLDSEVAHAVAAQKIYRPRRDRVESRCFHAKDAASHARFPEAHNMIGQFA